MNLLHLIILSLATWRISSLLTNDSEEGPFGILAVIRKYGRKLTDAFECLWCCSIWTGLILTIIYWSIPDYTTWMCLPLALSALTIIIERNIG